MNMLTPTAIVVFLATSCSFSSLGRRIRRYPLGKRAALHSRSLDPVEADAAKEMLEAEATGTSKLQVDSGPELKDATALLDEEDIARASPQQKEVPTWASVGVLVQQGEKKGIIRVIYGSSRSGSILWEDKSETVTDWNGVKKGPSTPAWANPRVFIVKGSRQGHLKKGILFWRIQWEDSRLGWHHRDSDEYIFDWAGIQQAPPPPAWAKPGVNVQRGDRQGSIANKDSWEAPLPLTIKWIDGTSEQVVNWAGITKVPTWANLGKGVMQKGKKGVIVAEDPWEIHWEDSKEGASVAITDWRHVKEAPPAPTWAEVGMTIERGVKQGSIISKLPWKIEWLDFTAETVVDWAGITKVFVCPPECTHCCHVDAPWWKLGLATKKFKCVFKVDQSLEHLGGYWKGDKVKLAGHDYIHSGEGERVWGGRVINGGSTFWGHDIAEVLGPGIKGKVRVGWYRRDEHNGSYYVNEYNTMDVFPGRIIDARNDFIEGRTCEDLEKSPRTSKSDTEYWQIGCKYYPSEKATADSKTAACSAIKEDEQVANKAETTDKTMPEPNRAACIAQAQKLEGSGVPVATTFPGHECRMTGGDFSGLECWKLKWQKGRVDFRRPPKRRPLPQSGPLIGAYQFG